MSVVTATGLRRTFGTHAALDGLDLQVDEGELFALLGPNGAGKSTTVRILSTLDRPDGGHATVAGHDVVRERGDVRRAIGVVFQDPSVDLQLTPREHLRFHADLYHVPRRGLAQRIDALLERTGLAERRDARVATLSGGMRRRLELARAVLHEPRVLFLDEPTVGLDPRARVDLWELVDELRRSQGTAVLLTTHYLDEAERCARVAILDQGALVACDAPARLRSAIGADRIELGTDAPPRVLAALREVGIVDALVEDAPSGGVVVRATARDAERLLPGLLGELGTSVSSVHVARPTLDDVFLAHTGRTIRQADATRSEPGGRLAARRRARGSA